MSTTQSAHYIVDESGALHDGNTWGMGNTDRWGIPNRWRVQSGLVLTFQGVTRWNVLAPGAVLPVARFATWREAMAYADRMARTREVVLPRGPYEIRSKQNIYEEPIKVEPITHFPGHETVAVKYTAQGVPERLFLAPDELRPLALALLALAEQEEHE